MEILSIVVFSCIAFTGIVWLSYDCIAINQTLTLTAKVFWIISTIIFPAVTILYFLKEKKHIL